MRGAAITLIALLLFAAPAGAAVTGGASPPDSTVAETGGAPMGVTAPPVKKKKKVNARRKSTRRKAAPRKPTRRKRRPAAPAPSGPAVGLFPIRGPYSFGDADARFGAPRGKRSHQGQDIVAAAGTPIVAPRAGIVKAVGYQADGAGYYVVLGSDRDYVFMHMQAASVSVRTGDAVAAGARIGRVGNTGRSFGPHLHFEAWTRPGWYSGGRPVDPLPFLMRWAGLA